VPKLLETPETIVEQQAVICNRKDIIGYTVEAPIIGGLVVRCRVLARYMDPLTGTPTESHEYQPTPLAGDAVNALSADAGVRTILRTISLLQLGDGASIGDLKTALAASPDPAGLAYYEGTRDALYETV
jgi:hypothetical protein